MLTMHSRFYSVLLSTVQDGSASTLFMYWDIELNRFTLNAHECQEFTYDATRSGPDVATVELQFRPRSQSTMIRPDF